MSDSEIGGEPGINNSTSESNEEASEYQDSSHNNSPQESPEPHLSSPPAECETSVTLSAEDPIQYHFPIDISASIQYSLTTFASFSSPTGKKLSTGSLLSSTSGIRLLNGALPSLPLLITRASHLTPTHLCKPNQEMELIYVSGNL